MLQLYLQEKIQNYTWNWKYANAYSKDVQKVIILISYDVHRFESTFG